MTSRDITAHTTCHHSTHSTDTNPFRGTHHTKLVCIAIHNVHSAKPVHTPIIPSNANRSATVFANQRTPAYSPSLTTTPLEPDHKPARRGISRRALIFGAAGIATAGTIGTGVFWFTRTPQRTLFVTYQGHSNYVSSVAWSPDGTRIASGSADSTVQVWNASDGSQPFTYRGHIDSVYAVACSPDGKRIASGSYDNTVQIWQAV